jgi:hypothetical protein
MKSQSVISIAFAVALSLSVGCNSPDPDAPLVPPGGGDSTEPAVDESAAPSPSGAAAIAPVFEREGSDTAAPTPAATPPEEMPSETPAPAEEEPVEEEVERVKADVGAAKAGRSLDEYEGVVVTPAKSLFAVRERMVFQAQIPSAMKLYEATNGNKPTSHEEFMTKIIEANQIQLPELPAGQRYAYDPEQGELMVEKPK